MTVECPKCQTENPDSQKFCGECATPLPGIGDAVHTKTLVTPIEELNTGSTFADRYQIIEELGKGGMGRVYKVLDKKTKERIALKLIKPEIASNKKTIERFKNELTISRKIRHKNVCGMYYLGEDKGRNYITMEFVSGEDLKSSIRRFGNLPIGKVIAITKQICEGLEEAHSLGIVHRDLKPNNIMIDDHGNARIMDFGIARTVKEKGITGSGVMIGTPEYMSPEQVEAKQVDRRSDVYSLGVIMYEMTTGSLPFVADTPFAVGIKQKSEKPQNPKDINPQIPEDFSRLILKCLEKDKEKRHQSARGLFSELNKIEKGIPTVSSITPKREPKTVKIGEVKWRNLIIFGGAVILLIVFFFGRHIFFPDRNDVIDSIAVLPLQNLSGDPEQEYFVDGMTDALIADLGKIGSLHVISRQSVMRYKRSDKSLPEIARELNVDAVVAGTVVRSEERVRINAQLIEGVTDRHLWARSYDRDLKDMIRLQSEVATAIAQEIKVKLTKQEEDLLAATDIVEPEAFEAYLKGRYHWNKRTEEGMLKAVEYFEQAVETSPEYAQAYAGLADSYLLLGNFGYLSPKEAILKVEAAAKSALELDDRLGEAHTSLAFLKHRFEWDWPGAEKEFQKAIELNPGYGTAHQWYGAHLAAMGRFDKALKEMRWARDLDPLSLMINADVGRVLYYMRRYDEAIQECMKAIEMDPNFAPRTWIAEAYLQTSRYEEAIEELKKHIKIMDREPYAVSSLAYAYAVSGKSDDALKLLDELKRRKKENEYIAPYYFATVYVGLGETSDALYWFEKAVEERTALDYLNYLNVEPKFDYLRSDPRFQDLLHRMGLPVYEKK